MYRTRSARSSWGIRIVEEFARFIPFLVKRIRFFSALPIFLFAEDTQTCANLASLIRENANTTCVTSPQSIFRDGGVQKLAIVDPLSEPVSDDIEDIFRYEYGAHSSMLSRTRGTFIPSAREYSSQHVSYDRSLLKLWVDEAVGCILPQTYYTPALDKDSRTMFVTHTISRHPAH